MWCVSANMPILSVPWAARLKLAMLRTSTLPRAAWAPQRNQEHNRWADWRTAGGLCALQLLSCRRFWCWNTPKHAALAAVCGLHEFAPDTAR